MFLLHGSSLERREYGLYWGQANSPRRGKTLGNCAGWFFKEKSYAKRRFYASFRKTLPQAGNSSKMELRMEALVLRWKLRAHFQPLFVGPCMGFVFLSSDWPACLKLVGMCKRSNIFHQRNIKLVLVLTTCASIIKLLFAHVNSMCKHSKISYERGIKLVFTQYINSMCKRSNIFNQRNIKLMYVY